MCPPNTMLILQPVSTEDPTCLLHVDTRINRACPCPTQIRGKHLHTRQPVALSFVAKWKPAHTVIGTSTLTPALTPVQCHCVMGAW